MSKGWVGLLAGAAGLAAGVWMGWQARGIWQQVSPWTGAVPVVRASAPVTVHVEPVAGPSTVPDPGAPPAPPVTPGVIEPAGANDLVPSADAAGGVRTPEAVMDDLRGRDLLVPVAGVPPTALVPSFDQARGERSHEAIDIMAPRGTPVVAVEDGTVAKLFTSQYGGLTIYQFDPTVRYAYYYAHLDRYAPGLTEGQTVRRGQTLGYVGSTGNASPSAPHLHFGVFLLTPERRWWQGTPVDPYAVWR